MNDKPICGGVIPPPIIYAICFLAGLGVDALWPLPLLPSVVQYAIGAPLIVAGLTLFVVAVGEFSRVQTAVTHHRPTTGIVSTGPFGFSRNPIYLAMTTVFLGGAIARDSLLVALHVVPAIARPSTPWLFPRKRPFSRLLSATTTNAINRRSGAEFEAYQGIAGRIRAKSPWCRHNQRLN